MWLYQKANYEVMPFSQTISCISVYSTYLYFLVPLCISYLVLQPSHIRFQSREVLLLPPHLHHCTQLLLKTITLAP